MLFRYVSTFMLFEGISSLRSPPKDELNLDQLTTLMDLMVTPQETVTVVVLAIRSLDEHSCAGSFGHPLETIGMECLIDPVCAAGAGEIRVP